MKNIVKVLRFKDNATRLYQLPTCYALDKGTVVEVEFGGGTAFGVTVSATYCGIYEEKMLRDLFNVLPSTEFKRVVAVHERNEVDWTATDASAADDAQEGVTGKILFVEEGENQEKTFPAGTEIDLIFTEAARMICFADCSNVQDVKVVIGDKHYSYAGWEPGMLYIFKDDETGEEVWSNRFPEWDH